MLDPLSFTCALLLEGWDMPMDSNGCQISFRKHFVAFDTEYEGTITEGKFFL